MDKKSSKLYKKAKAGLIMNEEQYVSCRELGVSGQASVSFMKDSTRLKSAHDLNANVIPVVIS